MIYSMTGLWCFMIAHGSAFQVTFYDRVVYAPGHEHSGWPRCWPLGPSSPRRIPDASLVKHSMKQSGPICFERLIIGHGRACPRSWLEPSQLCKSRRVCSMPKSDGYRSVIERYRMWPSAAPCTIGFCRRFLIERTLPLIFHLSCGAWYKFGCLHWRFLILFVWPDRKYVSGSLGHHI